MHFFPENFVYKKFYYINSLNFCELMGGGAQSAPPIFICENNRKSNKIMNCVEIFFLSDICEDRDILWAFFTNLSIEPIYLSLELREKWPYLQNYQSKKILNTVHNLITFSIVFTNKNEFMNLYS